MNLRPIVFLVSTDPFQERLYIEEIRKKLFPDGSGGFNEDFLDAKERSISEVFDLANTLPMLATHRLIVLRNAGSMEDEKKWLSYVDNPSPQTVLIVVLDKVDKRKKIFKTLEQKDLIVTLSIPKPRDLPSWIDRIARHHKAQISLEARQALIDAIGTDLSQLNQEIEKLSLFAHPEKTISARAVRELVLKTAGEDIFAFTDQVVEGRVREALSTLDHLLSIGTPPLVMVTMLARHYRILLKARRHLDTKERDGSIAEILGVPPFTVTRYLEQARRFSFGNLRKTLGTLAQLDTDLKSTGIPPTLLLEQSIRSFSQNLSR